MGVLGSGGCQLGPAGSRYDPDLAPTVDRLMAAYEDLASKRFQVLADFEEPGQGTLFRLAPPAGPGDVAISTERARSETGVGSLKMPLARSSQRVVCADSATGQWALHRDWSKYHLLLVNVFSPRKLGGFRLAAQSGTDLRLAYEHPRILLEAGWNLIRLDVDAFGEYVDLTDVRELSFWCDPLETPVELYLDDLILVDNTCEVFGSPEREAGDLYVRAQGRRLAVGAIERFELVFARGQIRQWFDLREDPARIHNLAGVGALGPSPVAVSADVHAAVLLDDASQWAGLGTVAQTRQSLVEATPLRVVVEGEWRFGSPDAPPAEDGPYHRWVYSIHADGRIYVACSGTARGPHFTPAALGMAFCCDGELGFERRIVQGRPGAQERVPGDESYVLFERSEPGQADLLVVPFMPLPVRVLENPRDPRLSVMWHFPVDADQFVMAAMLRVWPADLDAPGRAAAMATDYGHPFPIEVDAGQLVRTDPGDVDNDGFSETRGHYVLQLDGNVARVRLDGREQGRYAPLIRLVDVAERDVWVYVDGREIRDLQRDEEGSVLFQVPGVVSHEALIEVTSRAKGAGEG